MRTLDPATATAIAAKQVVLAFLAELTFKSGTVYAWTGIGPLTYNGNTYLGVGQLASVGSISEGVTVEARGTTVTLNGIDATLYADCMADIVTGKPATLSLVLLDPLTGGIIGTPIPTYVGMIDMPEVTEGGDDISITLHLETNLTNLQRANRKLYTSAEQKRTYPNDTGFDRVAPLVSTANQWG